MWAMDSSWMSVDWGNPVAPHPLNAGRFAWWLAPPPYHGGLSWRDLTSKRELVLTNMDAATDWTRDFFPNDGLWGDVDFDGSNDFATTFLSLNGLSAFTLAVTARIAINQAGYIVSLPNVSGGNGVDIYLNGTNSIRCWLNASGGNSGITGTYTYAGAGWLRIVSTYDGATHRLYINGALVTSGAKTGTVNTGLGQMWVGDFGTGFSDPAEVMVGDVSVWNRGLTQAEVCADYDLGRQFNRGTLNRWTRRFFSLGARSFNPAWARGSNVILPGAMA